MDIVRDERVDMSRPHSTNASEKENKTKETRLELPLAKYQGEQQ